MSKRLGASAALAVAALAAGGAQAQPVKDVRSTSDWNKVIRAGHTVVMPALICGGVLPSDYEAWSAHRKVRVGDDRLVIHTAEHSITSHYRGPVRVYIWCEEDRK